jgi:hypothetical protein
VREEVPAVPDAVRGFYVDLHNIKTVHPLVVSVRTISRNETADGYQQIYRVHDRIPLRMLTIRVSYQARLHVPTRGDVFIKARQFPWVRVNGIVTFELRRSAARAQIPIITSAVSSAHGLSRNLNWR